VISKFIRPNDRMSEFERLEIYNRQYWFRLLDCLYDDYPGLRHLLGEKSFHKLCTAYLDQCPSESFTLRNLGARLENFIRQHPQLTGRKFATAIDMARFEWAQTVAFDEAMNEPLHMDALLGADPQLLKLNLQPYLVLLDLEYEVDAFFMSVRQHEAGMRKEASNAIDGDRRKKTTRRISSPIQKQIWMAVHRSETEIYFLRLDREAYLLLKALQMGGTLAEALDAALADADKDNDWTPIIRNWFEQWASFGWFCSNTETTD